MCITSERVSKNFIGQGKRIPVMRSAAAGNNARARATNAHLARKISFLIKTAATAIRNNTASELRYAKFPYFHPSSASVRSGLAAIIIIPVHRFSAHLFSEENTGRMHNIQEPFARNNVFLPVLLYITENGYKPVKYWCSSLAVRILQGSKPKYPRIRGRENPRRKFSLYFRGF
jgi:hypothetical protein